MYRDISECYEHFAKAPRLALDLETSGLSPYKDNIAVVAVADSVGHVLVQHVWADGWPEALEMLLNRQDVEWITHNGFGFDWLFLKNAGFPWPPISYDTLVGEQVLIYQDRHNIRRDLGTTMKRRLGREIKKEMDHSGWTRNYLNDEQVKYAAYDVAYLTDLADAQLQVARERNMMKALEFEQLVAIIASKVMWNGMSLPLSILHDKRDQLSKETSLATMRVSAMFPGMNLNSSRQVREGVLAKLGLELPNAQKETLMEFQEFHPVMADIIAVKAAAKRTGFYDDAWAEKYVIDDRLHGHFWPLGANTGRFTSSNPNLQQIPRNMRGIIGNEPGKVVVAADYAQIEVRLMAFYAKDGELIKACEDDIHANMARVMFSVPADKPVPTELRSPLGKYGTFTWIFGGSHKGIINAARKGGTQLPEKTARDMKKQLDRRFWKTRTTHNAARRMVDKGSLILELPLGHKRQFLPGTASHTKWLNTLCQGSAAIGFKEALIEMDAAGLVDYLGGLVHDEFVATGIPANQGEEYAREMEECMITGMKAMMNDVKSRYPKSTYLDVPIQVESKINEAWS